MAMKTKRKPKAPPPMRIVMESDIDEKVYHSCEYLSPSTASAKYHDDSLHDSFENNLTIRLTERVKQIIAENPDTGLLKI